MKKPALSVLLAATLIPAAALAQLPGVDFTGTVSAAAGAPVGCESCADLGVHTTLGLEFRNRVGINYRGLRWGDQGIASDHRMATDLISLDFFLPTKGRVRPFVSVGGGHSAVKMMNVFEGAHRKSDYGPASALRTTFWGAGLDVRLVGHVALIAMLSSIDAKGAASPAQSCTQFDYLSGDFTWSCSGRTGQTYRLSGLSVGIGVR